jgi:hypothetical protein
MTEKNYVKKIEFQKKTISRQLEQIELLKNQVENLKLECEKKDETINSFATLKDELAKSVADVNKYKEEYKKLIDELKNMKEIMNQTVFKGKWRLVRFLIK